MTCFWRDVVNAHSTCHDMIAIYLPTLSGNGLGGWVKAGCVYDKAIVINWHDTSEVGSPGHLTWFHPESGVVINDIYPLPNQTANTNPLAFKKDCVLIGTKNYGDVSATMADLKVYDANTGVDLSLSFSSDLVNSIYLNYPLTSNISSSYDNYIYTGDWAGITPVNTKIWNLSTGTLLSSYSFTTNSALYALTANTALRYNGTYWDKVDLDTGYESINFISTSNYIPLWNDFNIIFETGTSFDAYSQSTGLIVSSSIETTDGDIKACRDGFITADYSTVIVQRGIDGGVIRTIGGPVLFGADGILLNMNGQFVGGATPIDGTAWSVGDYIAIYRL